MLTITKCHRLYWLSSDSDHKTSAGVAFYDPPEGDYRLKIDAFCDEKKIYLKPTSMEEGMLNFRVECMIRKNSGPPLRRDIGFGQASVSDGYPIYIDIAPFDRTLVLEAAV